MNSQNNCSHEQLKVPKCLYKEPDNVNTCTVVLFFFFVFFCHLILYFQDNSNVKKTDNNQKTNNAPCLSQAFSNKDQRIHAVSDMRYAISGI